MSEKIMPKLALGAWSWGAGVAGGDQVFGNHLEKEDLQPIFEAAMQAGLNLWDTATVYGMGASEDILGSFVRQAKPEDVIISTKFKTHNFIYILVSSRSEYNWHTRINTSNIFY